MTTTAPPPPRSRPRSTLRAGAPRFRHPGPGWWAAPSQAVRSPGLALALVGAVALLALATATRPLFTEAAGNDALVRELADFDPEALGAMIQVAGAPTEQGWRAADEGLRRAAADLGLPSAEPEIGPLEVTALHADSQAPAQIQYSIGFPVGQFGLYTREGAIAHLPERQGQGEGVWLPRRLADELGMGTGDEVALSMAGQGSVRVAGTYRDLVEVIPTSQYTPPAAMDAEDPIARYWSARERHIVQLNTRGDPYPSPPLIVAEPAVVAALGEELGVELTTMVWRFPIAAEGMTVEGAQGAQDALTELESRARDIATPLGSTLDDLVDRRQGGIAASSLLEGAIDRPAALVAALDASLAPLTLGAQALALLAVAGVVAFRVRRRRAEAAMLAVQGVGPGWIATRSAVETALPALAGGLVGAGTAVALASRVGPLDGGSGQLGQTVAAAALASGAAALLTAGVVGALASSVGAGHGSGRGLAILRRVPWEALLAAGALAAGLTLAGREGGLLVADGGPPRVDLLAVGFPLLLVAAVAAVVARAAGWLPRVLRRLGTRARPALYLAARRLISGRREAQAVLAALALGSGLVTFGLAAAASTATTIQAKAAGVAGAEVAVGLLPSDELSLERDVPTTEVRRTIGAVMPGSLDVELLAIDPATFAAAAAWVDGFSAQPLGRLLDELAQGREGGTPTPVLAVGVPAGSERQLVTDRYAIDVHVVAELAAFPGMRGDRALVVDLESLLAAADAAGSSIEEHAVLLRRREVWMAEDVLDRDALQRTHLQQRSIRTMSEVLDRPDLVAAMATLAFVRGVGIVAGALALLVLIAYAVARERARAAALAIASRMGLGSTTLRWAVGAELAGLLVIGLVTGGAAGLVAARLMTALGDPVPHLPPGPLFVVPLVPLGVAAGVLVGTMVLATVLADRARRRVSPAQVLRGG